MKLIKSILLVLFFLQSAIYSTFVQSQRFELFTQGVVCEGVEHESFDNQVGCFINPYAKKANKIDMEFDSDPNALIKNKKYIEYRAMSERFDTCQKNVFIASGAALLGRKKNDYSIDYVYEIASGHETTAQERATLPEDISIKIAVDTGYFNSNKSDGEVVKMAWEKCLQQSLEPYIKEELLRLKYDIANYEPDDEN